MMNKKWNSITVEFTLLLLVTSWQTLTFKRSFQFTEKELSARMRNYISSSAAAV